MKLRQIVTIAWSFLSCYDTYSQPAKLELRLIDSAASSYKEFVFEVKVINGSNRNLTVQDTTFLQERMADPTFNLLWPEIYRKVDSGYVFTDAVPRGGVRIPGVDTCLERCCNCIRVKKGEPLKFMIRLLTACELDKGEYRVSINLIQPTAAVKNRHKVLLVSNTIFVRVQ